MRLACLPFLISLLLPGALLGQAGTIRGTVEDADTGLPLVGANVMIVELTIGAATTIDGEYAIDNIPVGTYTVRTSFVGFRTVEHRLTVVQADLNHNVNLELDLARHDEILVTGMASRRSRATSDVAVGRIDATEPLKNNSYQDVTQLINGRVSGVTVQPASGNVATGMRFIMRSSAGLGDGQPIVYVDGARIHHYEENGVAGVQGVSQLAHLNPDDIETIDILKGPAGAALYGTSAANGVVLITTKKGSFGSGIRQGRVPFGVTYEGTFGQNRLAREYTVFNSSTPEATNAIFRNGGLSEHLISANGGSQSLRYYASYGARREDGHILGSSQDRRSFRASVEAFPATPFSVRANTAFMQNDVARPPNDFEQDGWLINTSLSPTPYQLADSVALANLTNLQQVTRFTGSADLRYTPVRDLTLKALAGYDGTNLRNDLTKPAGLRYRRGNQGVRNIFNKNDRLLTFDLNARYQYAVLTALTGSTTIGTQGTDEKTTVNGALASGFESDRVVAIQSGSDFTPFEGSSHVREMGVFALQDVAYGDIVFVTLGLRRDYASAFGFEAPSIVYPRASAALRIDNLVSLPRRLSFLKLRAAYGEAGRLPGPLDGQPLLWEILGTAWGTGVDPFQWGNPEIKPERTKEFETGLEAGFFGNRMNLELTYYRQTATDNIISLPNPPSSGWNSTPFNVASARGWGIETMLTAAPVRTTNTSLDVTLIWNWMGNEVTDLGGTPAIFDFWGTNVIKEGLPKEAYYVRRTVATFAEDGSYAGPQLASSVDDDGDGMPDREYLGTPYPDQSGSFQFNLRFFRNFHLTGLADWQLGLESIDGHRGNRAGAGTDVRRNIALVQIGVANPCDVYLCDNTGNLKSEFADIDVTPQVVGSEPYRAAAEVVGSTVAGLDISGNFLENASFFALREMSLRYDFSPLLRSGSLGRFFRSLSLTIAGRNLFIATPFGGADPLASAWGANADTGTGVPTQSAGFTLPNPRVLYARLTVGF